MLNYPLNEKGSKFNPKWYQDFEWLEYSKSKNAVFCFYCRHFGENNSKTESTYTKDGFINFRKAVAKFKEHQDTKTHKTAHLMYRNRKDCVDSCASLINSQHKKTFLENRSYLTSIIETIIWLAKQGLAFRGHNESESSNNKGNFLELTEYLSKYKPKMRISMEKSFNYLSPTIQNDLIGIISKEVVKIILPKNYFSIMVDETMDIAKHEQVAICLRYLDIEMNINE